jgi:hypothetical protein
MIRADIDIELHIKGPFLTKSSAPGEYGLDECVARDGDGRPYIPSTHVAGKLREAWEELASALEQADETSSAVPDRSAIGVMLGTEAEGDFSPRNKQLLFTDFTLYGGPGEDAVRYRIRIDPERGAVCDRAQLMLESPFASGDKLRFIGRLCVLASNEKEVETIRNQVGCGLQWVAQIGAFRSLGFGSLSEIELGEPEPIHTDIPDEDARFDEALGLVIQPESSFCTNASGPTHNLFESTEHIPGNAILGCLADMLNLLEGKNGRKVASAEGEFSALRENFSRLCVSHAFPSNRCMTRPVTMPGSLVKAGGDYDVALEPEPRLINGTTPAFQVDWKDDGGLRKRFGWPELNRELRVRTAIDSAARRAEDEKLFAYDMIRPDGCCWLSRIDLAGVPEDQRGEVSRRLRALLSLGLVGFGKSKTVARVNVLPGGEIGDVMDTTDIRGLGEDGLICLCLQTDALLLNPGELNETSTHVELLRAYRRIWSALCDGLRLARFFATQRLAGGEYQAHRFHRWGKDGEDYYPWLLTEAGSVFIFSVSSHDQAERKMEQWLRSGLPVAPAIRAFYGLPDDRDQWWKWCPYIPQNGYGEIAVNLEVHKELQPPPPDRSDTIHVIDSRVGQDG